MAELALALSIVSLIKLSNTVLSACADYVDKVKNAPSDTNKIINEVSGLVFILKRLSRLGSPEFEDSNDRSIDGKDPRLVSLKALHDLPIGPFHGCNEALAEIAKKLDKIAGSGSGPRDIRRRLIWPFEKGKLDGLLSGLEKHKTTFLLALTGDLHEREEQQSEAIAQIGTAIEDLKLLKERSAIVEWLQGSDPSTNHNAARRKHAAGTGDWLLNLDQFKSWKGSEGGLLWLNGISGAGKTVLSSTVIELFKGKDQKCSPETRTAYFYFDFNDAAKQKVQECIQSLMKQLFEQSDVIPDSLQSIYSQNKNMKPGLEELVEVFISMLDSGASTTIIIDALDECNSKDGGDERKAFFEVLGAIRSSSRARFFIASRREVDIERELTDIGVIKVEVKNTVVEDDIRAHIQAVLPKEPHFKTWPESVKKRMEDTLVSRSHGMFRWVSCQLDALRKCVKPANALRQLENLPETLEETYARILQQVPSENERELKSILMLLSFSARPMTIQEVAEATAVDLDAQLFSVDERFGDAYEMLALCSSLVSLTELGADSELKKENKWQYNWDKDIRIIQFAHFSVKEYILSDTARKSIPRSLFINETLCRRQLTEMCLIYLLDFNNGERATKFDHNEFPFLGYAALHWTTHLAVVSETDREDISKLLIRFFDRDHPESLMNYLNIYDPVLIWNTHESRHNGIAPRTINFGTTYRNKQDFQTPLYYASLYGLDSVVAALRGKHSIGQTADELGSALEAAASGGHDEIIKRLLAEGADPNAKYCTQYFRPIQAAASSDSPSTVKLLLSAGADISPASYGGELGTALHAAARNGNVECVQALVDAGHELNCIASWPGYDGTPLSVAAYKGRDAAVQCLLRNGADPIACTSASNYPLNRACEHCSFASVEALLGAGANVDGISGQTPLQDAAERGELSIMKLLLERGANVDAPGGIYGTCLKAAIQSRDPVIFKFMLDHGANINAVGSSYEFPVDQAIFAGNLEAADKLLGFGAKFSGDALVQAVDYETKEYLVKILLDRGADPNTEHERQGNVLQLAISKRCRNETIRWLLEAGADINAVEGEYGTALQAAVYLERLEVVSMLFEFGAGVNLPSSGTLGNPLQAAVQSKNELLIQLLLDNGADIHALGGTYGSILQTAAAFGNESLVKHLLKSDVELDLTGGEYGTALCAAIAMEHKPIVQLLLDNGADINIKAATCHATKARFYSYSHFHSVLEVATASCNSSIFKLLVDHGMACDAETTEAALVHAVNAHVLEDKFKMLDLLVSHGGDVRLYGGKAVLYACEVGKIEVVRKLLSLGAPVNWIWEGDNGSALMSAIDRGHADIALELLDAGADVDLAAGRMGTALIHAIEKGNSAVALELLNRGADPNIKAGHWGAALAVAARKGDEDMVYELLNRGADVNLTHGYSGTALQAAISQKYYHLAQELLDRGADPSAPGVYASPLICASGYGKSGQLELIKRLLELGVDLEVYDSERPEDKGPYMSTRWLFNALQNAARAGNEAVTKLLLDAGANINSVGGTLGTAIQAAAKENHENIVELLLDCGADINLVGGDYGTPLQAAAHDGRTGLFEILLSHGAGVNVEGGDYGTALQAACTTSRAKLVNDLIARGARVNTNCGKYGNPLQAAVRHGNVELVKILLEHGADVNLPGGQYGFPLQAAMCSDGWEPENLEIVQILLYKGADVNAEGGEFGTALQAAAFHRRQYVEILLEHGAVKTIKGGKYGSALGAAKEKGLNRVVKLLS